MLYCPQCGAEYRPGFTHCADCDVDLVAALPQAQEPPVSAPPSGTLQILWEGEDLALFENLLDALEAVGIPYFDQPLGIYPGVRRRDPFPVQPLARFGYQVAVLSSEIERARQILERLLGEKPQNRELPAQDEKQSETPAEAVFREEDSTFQVWFGSKESTAEFVEAALKENGIPTRREPLSAGIAIYVPPSKETTAKEIIREIVESTQPE